MKILILSKYLPQIYFNNGLNRLIEELDVYFPFMDVQCLRGYR